MAAPVVMMLGAAMVGSIARTMITAIGVGIVSFVGIEALLTAATGTIKSALGSNSYAASWLGMMGIDRAVTLVLSGYSVRLTLGVLESFRLK